MFPYSKYNFFCSTATFLCLLIILFVRIYSIYVFNIPLHFDEAQYWGWSQKLEWGYFSKPPVLAWIIGVNTFFCGDTEFCIRLSSPILYFFSSIFVFLSTKLLSQNNFLSGFSAIVFNLIPGITFSSLINTTDVPLIFFSSLFGYLFFIIYKKKNPSYLYYFLLSLAFTLGFLSKYAMFYLLISLIILLLNYKNVRNKFVNLKGLFFIFSFFLLIIPHLYWNYDNGFVTFSHTADNANIQKININIEEFFLFILSQFVVFGVYPFYYIICRAVNIKKLNEEKEILYIFFFTPLIIVTFIALFSRANANWAVVGYPFGCILLAQFFDKKEYISKKIYSLISQATLSITILILILIGRNNITLDPFAKQRHAKDLAEYVKTELISINNVAFMADDREDFALMLFYLKEFKGKRAKWNGDIKINDHYELTTNVDSLIGHNVLFLTRTAPTPEMLDRSAASYLLKAIKFSDRNKTKNYNLYLLKNWK